MLDVTLVIDASTQAVTKMQKIIHVRYRSVVLFQLP